MNRKLLDWFCLCFCFLLRDDKNTSLDEIDFENFLENMDVDDEILEFEKQSQSNVKAFFRGFVVGLITFQGFKTIYEKRSRFQY